jgi:light-regulated signal transduction histidine kinase (bacteriophytochrome)
VYPDYRIISKQSYSRPDTTYNYRQIVFASLVTGFIAIMALTLFNRRMSSLVVDRTKDLKSEIQERVQVEPQVRELNIGLEQRVKERTIQLEAANQELDSFAYSVSHDLRAPLRGIDGFSLALMEDYHDQLDDNGKDYINRVRGGCHRMGSLIDDLLIMSRMTRCEMNRKDIDLSKLVLSTLENLKQLDSEREVAIEVTPGIRVNADSNLIQAVLDNLLGNAWKFTGKTEKAKIEFSKIIENEQPIFYIKDNGAGFDMAYANKLFGAFQRFHSLSEFEGTGIGLATVQRIIHRHGGTIRAEGAVGQGAVFYFTL